MPDSGMTIEERFASLEHSNTILSGDVQALTRALTIVNDLQTQQREIKRSVDHAAEKAAEADRTAKERSDRTRRVVRGLALALAVLLPLVALLMYLALLQQVNMLLDSGRQDRLRACQQRNSGTQAHIDREQALAEREKTPDLARIHQQSAEQLKQSIVDCSLSVR